MWYKDYLLESRHLVWSRLTYLPLIDDFEVDIKLNGRHFPSKMLDSRRPWFAYL